MRLSHFLAALALAATACTAAKPGESKIFRPDVKTPADLAVLPVEDATGHRLTPTEEIRSAATQALLDRGYSVLHDGLVDREVGAGPVEASAAAIPDAGALKITVTNWRERDIEFRGRLRAEFEVVLFGPDGEVLARAGGPGEVRLDGADMDRLQGDARRETLLKSAVGEVLALLPPPPPL